jgi:hypothetical protein
MVRSRLAPGIDFALPKAGQGAMNPRLTGAASPQGDQYHKRSGTFTMSEGFK